MSASPELAGQSIVMCTGEGLVTISFDAQGNPVKNGADAGQACAWCTGFSGPPTLTDETRLAAFELRLVEYTYSIQPNIIWHSCGTPDGFPIRATPTTA